MKKNITTCIKNGGGMLPKKKINRHCCAFFVYCSFSAYFYFLPVQEERAVEALMMHRLPRHPFL